MAGQVLRRAMRLGLLPGLVLGLLGAPHGARAMPQLVLDLAGQGPTCEGGCAIGVGESVSVAVRAEGIPVGSDGRGLFGFGFRLAFDGLGLAATGLLVDPQWIGLAATENAFGAVGATANLLGIGSGEAGPSGDGVALATLELEGLAPGLYALSLAPFTGPGDNVLFDGTVLDGATGFFAAGSLRVVPEPGSAGLAAAGLLLAGAAVRRSRPV